ncbi:MAG: hypothetical protein E7D13_03795 [Finegoldia magna]|nr:hypothetical protein [Finegoldia magna]
MELEKAKLKKPKGWKAELKGEARSSEEWKGGAEKAKLKKPEWWKADA